MRSKRFIITWAVAAVFARCHAIAQTVYWTDVGSRTIQRVRLPGGEVETLLHPGLEGVGNVLLDERTEYVVFVQTEGFPGDSRIRKVSIHGSEPVDILLAPGRLISHLRLDGPHGMLYWIDGPSIYNPDQLSIRKCSLDGTGETAVIDGDLHYPGNLHLDAPRGHIYWTDTFGELYEQRAQLIRAALDGTQRTTVVAPFDSRLSVAVDGTDGYLYWGDAVDGSIRRSNLQGGSIEPLVSSAYPSQILVNRALGRLYWSSGYEYGLPPWYPGSFVYHSDLEGINIRPLLPSALTHTYGSLHVSDETGEILFIDYRLSNINHAAPDGSDIQTVIGGGVGWPVGLALDPQHSSMLWTDFGLNSVQRIDRSHLDGSDQQNLLNFMSENPRQIAISPDGGYSYWTSDDAQYVIWRLHLLSGIQEGIVASGGVYQEPRGIAFDLLEQKMYWATVNLGVIQRANLDGSDVETFLADAIHSPYGVAIDPVDRLLYWSESALYGGKPMIRRIPLSGGSTETLVEVGLDSPRSLAIDADERKLYWTDAGTFSASPRIARASLDGSDVENLVVDGLQVPIGIAIDTRIPNDCDGDGSFRASDILHLADCASGPGSSFSRGCACADSDGDGDVDLRDYAAASSALR